MSMRFNPTHGDGAERFIISLDPVSRELYNAVNTYAQQTGQSQGTYDIYKELIHQAFAAMNGDHNDAELVLLTLEYPVWKAIDTVDETIVPDLWDYRRVLGEEFRIAVLRIRAIIQDYRIERHPGEEFILEALTRNNCVFSIHRTDGYGLRPV